MRANLYSLFRNTINKHLLLKRVMLRIFDWYQAMLPGLVGSFTRNPAYIYHLLHSKLIAKPGTLSFGAIFNPGALLLEDEILLLANGQHIPWFKARGKKREWYMQGNPVFFTLDPKDQKIKDQGLITEIKNFPIDHEYALEDYRLFPWKGKNMINHSLVQKERVDGFIGQSSVRSVLSELNKVDQSVQFVAQPKVDFPVQNFEKNWVYKENGSQLLLFYSLNPYRILTLDDEEKCEFKTIINRQFSEKINNPGGFGTMASFSTNPIDFDEKHWLVIIHQINHKFTGRCYYHWAVLIDKSSLLPMKITSKPIFSGMGARGRLPGIRYISSILKVEDEILFFAGEGDIYVTVTKKSVKEIQKFFVDV